MSESPHLEADENITKPKYPDEKGIENRQNNALLYLILKEGYSIVLPKKDKTNYFHKCISIENEDEILNDEGIEEIGKELSEIIKYKASKGDKEIIIEPKDLFDDGKGIENEKL